MQTEELVTVYTVSHAAEAEIIKNALEIEGIRAFLEGINQAFEVGLVPQVRVQVGAADAERARAWIEAHEGSGDDEDFDSEDDADFEVDIPKQEGEFQEEEE